MGVAVELLDAVTALIDAEDFGTATVERQIMPNRDKLDLTVPNIVVCLNAKESSGLDRTGEYIKYTVAVALYFPTTAEADHETALDLVEDVQDLVAKRENRSLTLTSGKACLVLPFMTEPIFDSATLRESAVFFSVTSFTYHYYKGRT